MAFAYKEQFKNKKLMTEISFLRVELSFIKLLKDGFGKNNRYERTINGS